MHSNTIDKWVGTSFTWNNNVANKDIQETLKKLSVLQILKFQEALSTGSIF